MGCVTDLKMTFIVYVSYESSKAVLLHVIQLVFEAKIFFQKIKYEKKETTLIITLIPLSTPNFVILHQ